MIYNFKRLQQWAVQIIVKYFQDEDLHVEHSSAIGLSPNQHYWSKWELIYLKSKLLQNEQVWRINHLHHYYTPCLYTNIPEICLKEKTRNLTQLNCNTYTKYEYVIDLFSSRVCNPWQYYTGRCFCFLFSWCTIMLLLCMYYVLAKN